MTGRLRKTLRTLRADQTGSSLPEAVVSVTVNALTMGIIASAIIVLSMFQAELGSGTKQDSAVLYAETEWRKDVANAVAVTVTGATEATFTVRHTDGCRQNNWKVTETAERNDVTVTRTNFDGLPTLSGCSGTQTTTGTETILANVPDGVAFQFRNPGGRDITFTAGTPTLADANRPPKVSATKWASTAIGAGILSTTDPRTAKADQFRIAQIAGQTSELTGAPDAATTFNAP